MRLRAAALCLWLLALLPAQNDDPILRAMRDELQRARGMKVLNLESPYFIQYALEDAEMFSASATLGGLTGSRHDHMRLPEIRVRVGDYKFDNSNYIGSGFSFGSRYEIDSFPLENDYALLRRYLWLSTDSAYKSAVEAISRKRAALKNMAVSEPINDYARAEPVKVLLKIAPGHLDEALWQARLRALSAIFAEYPQVKSSSVEINAVDNVRYLVNSEGTEARDPEMLAFLRARATAQASDGMTVHDAIVFHSLDFNRLPPDADLKRGLVSLAENVTALARAPVEENYNGPILFEGAAAAQLFAQVLGKNLTLARRPVTEPGRGGAFPTSELEGRQGVRIMPEFFDVVDDPTQDEWRGRPLFGRYHVDREGVIPKPLTLVEKGVLRNFLLTRQPVRGFEGSNGRARLPGGFGADSASFSNLFVRASQAVSLAELKKKMIETCRNRSKPYGIVVRKLDFPSSASYEEVRRLLSEAGRSGGARAVSPPTLVYRLYTDGREELVRGVRFGGLSARSLKDILAAGDDSTVFEFLDNPAPFALMGAGGYVLESCVISPSVLIDDLELHKIEEELPKLPIVPAP